MTDRPARRPVRRVAAAYAALGAGWCALAWGVAPRLIAAAYQGRSLPALNRVFQRHSAHPLPHYLGLWNALAGAVLLAGGLHLAFVLIVLRPGAAGERRRLSRGLVLVGAAFLGLTVLSGPRHDYVADLLIWDATLRGGDPWWIVPARAAPLNAYGPLFNVLAVLAWVNPLAPKLGFAFTMLLFAAWLEGAAHRAGPGAPGAWPALLGNPYVWVETAYFGHFDVLVGVACVAALHARRHQRDARAGACLAAGALVKFLPVVLLPFLALDGRRVRLRLAAVATAVTALGMGASVAAWGPSTFRPVVLAGRRHSQVLSVFRFLRGRWSPLRAVAAAPDCDALALPCLAAALACLFAWCWARRVEPAAAAVSALLATLLLYPVGFAQYQIVLLLAAVYWWCVAFRGPRGGALAAGLWAYFGWLASFNVFSAWTGGVIHPDDPWAWVADVAGLPTFVLGSYLLWQVVRVANRRAAVGS
jgi:hypothetical protein